MEACLAVLLLEEDSWAAAEVAAGDTLLIHAATLFQVGDVVEAMRRRLAPLDGPAPLEAFWPAIPVGAPDRALARRAAVSCTLIAAIERGRRGEILLEQEDRNAPVLLSSDLQQPGNVL